MARLHFWVMLQNTFLLGVIWLHSLIKVDLCDGYMICIFLPLFVQDSGCITKDYMELWVTLAWNKRSLKLIIIKKDFVHSSRVLGYGGSIQEVHFGIQGFLQLKVWFSISWSKSVMVM